MPRIISFVNANYHPIRRQVQFRRAGLGKVDGGPRRLRAVAAPLVPLTYEDAAEQRGTAVLIPTRNSGRTSMQGPLPTALTPV